jgi:lipoprotein-anchoring transpeptidase ErfK/SrfK
MSPLSPDVEDKLIEVDLKAQRVMAYEDGVEVYAARCATGGQFTIEGLGAVSFATPTGKHRIVRKRPSRHMMGSVGRSDFYDLPGVPFCTYFTEYGAAIHGAYWHNDFGRTRSHGCVNVLTSDALWFYRWSNPHAPYEEPLVLVKEGGTPIVVS